VMRQWAFGGVRGGLFLTWGSPQTSVMVGKRKKASRQGIARLTRSFGNAGAGADDNLR